MRRLLCISMFALLAGCGIGRNSVLFVTKTNVGLDFDSTPPAAELSISRKEGVVAPTFEEGKTLPVIASVRATGRGIFAGGISQTFATGDAASTMSRLFGDENPCPGAGSLDECYARAGSNGLTSKLVLKGDPKIEDGEKPRPVFFGTATTIGVHIGWATMTNVVPDSLSVGYRRKELAMAPVMQSKDGTSFQVRLPSLLGTIGFDGAVSSPQETTGSWTQYFATGNSASALALKKEVRQAMLVKMNPAYQPFFGEVRPVKVGLLMNVCRDLSTRSSTDATAKNYYFRTNAALVELAPMNYEFNRASTDDSGVNVITETTKGTKFPSAADPCVKALQYRSELDLSISHLDRAVQEGFAGKVDGKVVTTEILTGLVAERDAQKALLHQFDQRLKAQPVVDEVFYYWMTL